MAILDYKDCDALGKVIAVDTAVVVIRVDDLERLKRVQVNRLAVLQCNKPGHHLVGLVSRITRKPLETALPLSNPSNDEDLPENNLVRISLIGTFIDNKGSDENVFQRSLETVPEIDANCFTLEDNRLTDFMQAISDVDDEIPHLEIGNYSLDEKAVAYLNGNRLFQRHAMIVGSTGSGKSWTTALMLEKISQLEQANAILFDIHGEYQTFEGDEFQHYRIAGSNDLGTEKPLEDNILFLPYWLLGYEAMVSLFVDRSDQNAPNQAMAMSRQIMKAKKSFLKDGEHKEILNNFTLDSPVPFYIDPIIEKLDALNTERVPNETGRSTKQGVYYGKFSRLIARFESKRHDRRLGFLFQPPSDCMDIDWLSKMALKLVEGRGTQENKKGGIKIIDFSEVPSDILPLMVSLLAQVIFTIAQWTETEERHPIALFCDEAHLYIPNRMNSNSVDSISVGIFERIAKEGRKYGVGLVVISQRPSEVNRTVLSQCNNVIAMRLTNGEDQSVIKRLLPDGLGGISELLPILDVGEALVVGDASLLPTRVHIAKPKFKPNSDTIQFWDRWNSKEVKSNSSKAVQSWRRQSNQLRNSSDGNHD